MNYTMQDVADRAKVSIATVSRVLNNQEGYSEATKEKVLKVIEELDYQRNNLARSLVTKTSLTIGVLMPNVATTFSGQVLDGIEDYAHQNGYSVIICNTGGEGIRVSEYLKVLHSRQIDGMINISIDMEDKDCETIKKSEIPYIQVCMQNYKYQFPYVKVDDYQASYTATQYLIEKGHKRIAFISGPKEDRIAGKPRLEGYKNALIDYGIEVDKSIIKYGKFSYEDGVHCMKALLDEGHQFTALFAVSDDMAVGALQVATQHGIHVPKDLSILGYDNTLIAQMSNPPLSVLGQPLYELGNVAASKLIGKIRGEETFVTSTILPHQIIERETVASV